jgi:hypothetical protein
MVDDASKPPRPPVPGARVVPIVGVVRDGGQVVPFRNFPRPAVAPGPKLRLLPGGKDEA